MSDVDCAVCISGNKEGYLGWLSREDQSLWTAEQMAAIYQTYRELTPYSFEFIKSLRSTAVIPLSNGGNMFACHCLYDMPADITIDYGCDGGLYEKMVSENWSRADFNRYFHSMIERDGFRHIIDSIDAKVILMGHNHIQGHGYSDKKLIVNPGSVGVPLDLDPRAAYTVIEETSNGFDVTERRIEYDIESLINSAKQTEIYRQAKIWCDVLFKTLKTGRDYNKSLLKAARDIANKTGEQGRYFSNEVWRSAWEAFNRKNNQL